LAPNAGREGHGAFERLKQTSDGHKNIKNMPKTWENGEKQIMVAIITLPMLNLKMMATKTIIIRF
jgi:hypothetical protein